MGLQSIHKFSFMMLGFGWVVKDYLGAVRLGGFSSIYVGWEILVPQPSLHHEGVPSGVVS